MSTEIKFSQTQIPKLIQSDGSSGSWLGNLGKKPLETVAIPSARDDLPGLVRNLQWLQMQEINLKEKISGKRVVQSRKRICFIYFEWRYKLYY